MSLHSWLTVIHASPTTNQRWLELLDRHTSIERIPSLPSEELSSTGLSDVEIDRLKRPDEAQLERWHKWLDRPGNALITRESSGYPPLLATASGAPLALWASGQRVELLKAPQLAVVGSRTPTTGGRETAHRFARYLSANGLAITSGLATGIDGASHAGALEGGSGTVAVLGSGLDNLFPRSHRALADAIRADGVIVSEYPPETAALRAHFPQRNRIIAGLSLGTLVVEAARRSGSLITARR